MSFSKLRNTYENFVCDSSWYVALLDAAKSFSVFLPGRFSQTQISGEVVYTVLTLLSHYHDGVLGRPRVHPAEIKTSDEEPMVCMPPSSLEKTLNTVMFGLISTQTLIENLSGHVYRYLNGDRFTAQMTELQGIDRYKCSVEYEKSLRKFTWTCILAVESIKAIIRLIFLYKRSGRMLLPPSTADTLTEHRQRMSTVHLRKLAKDLRALKEEIVQAESDLAKLNTDNESSENTDKPSQGDLDETVSNTSAEVVDLSTKGVLDVSENIALKKAKLESKLAELKIRFARLQHTLPLREEYLKHGRGVIAHGEFSTFQQDRVHPRETPAFKPSKGQIFSEIIYWLRPVIYAWVQIITPQGSWKPVLISAFLDLLSRRLAGKISEMSPAQQQQMTYRKHLYFYYFFRTPIFEKFTMVPLFLILRIMRPIPVVGSIVEVIIELIMSMRMYHFFTSAS